MIDGSGLQAWLDIIPPLPPIYVILLPGGWPVVCPAQAPQSIIRPLWQLSLFFLRVLELREMSCRNWLSLWQIFLVSTPAV